MGPVLRREKQSVDGVPPVIFGATMNSIFFAPHCTERVAPSPCTSPRSVNLSAPLVSSFAVGSRLRRLQFDRPLCRATLVGPCVFLGTRRGLRCMHSNVIFLGILMGARAVNFVVILFNRSSLQNF